MKRHLLLFFFITAFTGAFAQTGLAPDQNPNYNASRDKYMRLADSITSLQGTTYQDTYRAIDYLEDKRKAREQRRQFRRELRMERARNAGYYYYEDYYTPYNYNYYPYRSYRYYRYNRGWYGGYYYNNTLPLAATLATLGTIGWLWCR